jgi:hypothetical protein
MVWNSRYNPLKHVPGLRTTETKEENEAAHIRAKISRTYRNANIRKWLGDLVGSLYTNEMEALKAYEIVLKLEAYPRKLTDPRFAQLKSTLKKKQARQWRDLQLDLATLQKLKTYFNEKRSVIDSLNRVKKVFGLTGMQLPQIDITFEPKKLESDEDYWSWNESDDLNDSHNFTHQLYQHFQQVGNRWDVMTSGLRQTKPEVQPRGMIQSVYGQFPAGSFRMESSSTRERSLSGGYKLRVGETIDEGEYSEEGGSKGSRRRWSEHAGMEDDEESSHGGSPAVRSSTSSQV